MPPPTSDPPPSPRRPLVRLSVGHKLAVIFLAFFLLTAGSLALVETLYNSVADASRLINDSGKLRYLSQRLAFYTAESALQNRPSEAIPPLMQRFEATLALIERESAFLSPLMLRESAELSAQLNQVHESWRSFRFTLEKTLADTATVLDPGNQSRFNRETDAILASTDQVVSTLTAAAQQAHRHIDWLIAGVVVFNLLFLVTLIAYTRWRIVTPLVTVTGMVKRFAAGDRSVRMQNHRYDEIGELMQGFNLGAEQMDSYISEISRFEEILEATPDFVASATPDCKALFLNRAMRDLFGLEAKENIVGTNIATHYPAWAYSIVQHTGIPTAIAKGFWEGETALLRKDGKEIPVSQVIIAHKMPDGTVDRLSSIMRDISERIAMEERLTRSRDMYLKLFHDFPILVWRAGTEGKLDFFNRAWLDFTGRTLEQEQNDGWTAVVNPEDLERCMQVYRDAFEARSAFSIEFRMRRHDGEYRWMIGQGAPFTDMDGNFAGYVGSVLDMSERRQAEAELRKLSLAVEQSASSIVITNREGLIEYANPYLFTLSGYTREEVIGHNPRLWQSGQTPIETYQKMWQTLLDGKVWRGELLNRKKNGELIWEEATFSPVKNEKGEITHFVAVKQDITQRKEAEEKLRLWQRALESSVNAITITDATQANFPYVYVNPAFERITGYSAEEALGKNGRFLQNQDIDQPELEHIRRAVREQRDGKALLRNYRKDGSLFWNELYISPVRNDGGKVTHYIGIQNDVTERKQYEEQLAYQSAHDTLTRLPNRNLAQDRLTQGIIFARRTSRQLAMLLIDIDNFKLINDSLGHNIGDQLLKIVAHRIEECVRGGDTVARLGGDDFAVILTDVSQEDDISRVTNKILAAIAEPAVVESHSLTVTCSIGVSLFPRDGEDAATLLKNADAAMYRAKEQGRNSVQYYTAEINSRIFQRLILENNLRVALERDEFAIHYQPQVSLLTGQVTGMEALLRWHHPELGMVSPVNFIPLAEDTGLIIPIGAWVLHTACRQTRAWHEAGLPLLRVAVNISGRQFRENIPQLVEKALAESGLPPQYLELEITESVAMQHAESTEQTLSALRDMGVRLSIDDFGTGYSSLSYLKRFPINKLKLDQSFVRDIISDPDDAAISMAIIALAHGLKLDVIAEGVETESQLDFLRTHGCDAIQGYYFSRPVPAEQMEQLLHANHHLELPSEKDRPLRTLLLVDDEPNILASLQRLLRHAGYHILTSTSPAEAFDVLAKNPVSVIVSDQRMPEMSGSEFLSRVHEMYPDTVRMVLSGYADLASVTEAVNRGAIYKFLTKPWEDDALRAQIADAFRYHETMQSKT
ncbi:MAG: PAS domain S-box protein [Sulfuricella denitrificans]|nr:PAS domain S-box protein [Sulfuricella denitrificans]